MAELLLPLVQVLASGAAASSEGGMATLAFLAAGGESEPGVQSSTADGGGTAEEEAGVATELDIYWKEHMSSYSLGCQHKQTTS